ncbi:MAG: hypothetical protein HQK93_07545, partial [Nitrospirae bacterium]|nr:hypothetical protein [Nitrospirota bacterium]
SLYSFNELKELIFLEYLELADCSNLINTAILKNLINLNQLYVSRCDNLINIDDLRYLLRLTDLTLSHCYNLINIDGLKNLTGLKLLSIDGLVFLNSLDVLNNLTALEDLDLSDCCNLLSIDGIEYFHKLLDLNITGFYKLHNINALRHLSKLESLWLDNSQIIDYSILGTMPKLDAIFLNYVGVPKYIVVTPADELNPGIILTEKSAEIRREIIRKIGIDRVISELGAEVINRWEGYELLKLNIPNTRRKIKYLKMKNPSTETWHIEGVSPRMRTCQGALKWRTGGIKWRPAQLT